MAQSNSESMHSHSKPPDSIKDVYKRFQKVGKIGLEKQPDLLDLDGCSGDVDDERIRTLEHGIEALPCDLRQVFLDFLESSGESTECEPAFDEYTYAAYEVKDLPGLYIYPSLLPDRVQLSLLDKVFHRDLSDPSHKTNIHAHYTVPYPEPQARSFFHPSSSTSVFQPKDPSIHKPLSTTQFLTKKLRWMTLGGQYDWTSKLYPSEPPPAFPTDIKKLIENLFPSMRAEAAIVNLYSPGDTLSLHRDVSEECGADLVSISLGCDGIFIVGIEDADGIARVAAMRLRSGDAVLMSGKSRFAWHGVAKILEETCPEYLRDWPGWEGEGSGGEFGDWMGWMAGKRINLNVRQMFA